MRKKYRQYQEGEQLRLFEQPDVSFRPVQSRSGGTAEGWARESEYFSLLDRNRALTTTLLDRVMSIANLEVAYRCVRKNGGASGVDKMKVGGLPRWLQEHGKSLRGLILTENYTPDAVLGVSIPKANGGERLLGIPTVKDRLIQQALHQQLSVIYDPLFSDHSYGFRPGRSALQAVEKASEYISSGSRWVVDIDLASYFDTINHDRLMHRLWKGIGDHRVLRLIRKYLKAEMMLGGLEEQRTKGTPQGGPLSPLLSNIVLDELDKELESRGHKFVRYADDCNIYVGSQAAGERVLASMTRFIEGKLKLKVNGEKSGVRRCEEVKFLGYTILPDGRKRIADKSIARFKKKVRELTKRNRGMSFKRIITELNRACRGWVNYFKLVDCWLPWRELDGWIRRRLRCYRLKQCGRKYTIFKFLRKLGAEVKEAWNAIRYGGDWWSLSMKVVCSKAMGLSFFHQQGLYALKDLHAQVKSVKGNRRDTRVRPVV